MARYHAGSSISGRSAVQTIPFSQTLCPPTACSASVTVIDEIAPDVNFPTTVGIDLDGSGMAAVSLDSLDGGTTDACGTIFFVPADLSLTCADVGSDVLTLTAMDDAGNAASFTTTIVVSDVSPPAGRLVMFVLYFVTYPCRLFILQRRSGGLLFFLF